MYQLYFCPSSNLKITLHVFNKFHICSLHLHYLHTIGFGDMHTIYVHKIKKDVERFL